MENQSFQKYKWIFALGAVICWLSIATQLYLTLQTAQLSLIGTIVKFFSYFTILTNIAVALCVSSFALGKGFLNFFKSPITLGAVVVYITIVGIVYNVILRYQWNPEGMNRVVDEMLHTVIPTGFVVFWLLAIPKNMLDWKHIPAWLAYPAVYIVYTLIRGHFVNSYPYPFIDVVQLGYATALVNTFYVVIAFLIVSILIISIGKLNAKKM